MAVFKCGTLEFAPGDTVAVCDSCGTKQTLPKLDDDRRANLYDRANHFRRNNEFDKAEGIYEQILNEDNTDAEAYWSLVLCHYGIEYVEDPATHHRVPTINRTQFTSIFDDANYKSALKYGDAAQIEVYEAEAVAINEIQKGILSISQREEPFDVFICYKETDEHGRRTQDSVLANELYHELTREGFKVFFSRITLENKLGTAYEPYIFAALNSAKVMVVIGTKPEYFNAVWVKNEWSRYLALIKNGARKILIPAYRDMNPYDLPEEFSHLQAQDMGKLGFMQDLIRGIKKLTESSTPKGAVEGNTTVNMGNVNLSSLLKRVFLFLEDGNWKEADAYCERVLDQDPECAEAYLGKLMAKLQARTREGLKNCAEPFDGLDYYRKTVRFADEKLKEELSEVNKEIRERKEKIKLEGIYKRAITAMKTAESEITYKEAADMFGMILEYGDAKEKKEECLSKSEKCRKDRIYDIAQMIMVEAEDKIDEIEILPGDVIEKTSEIISDYKEAIRGFKMISGWRDSDNQIYLCEKKIEEIKQQQEYIEKRVHIAAEKKAGQKKLFGCTRSIVFMERSKKDLIRGISIVLLICSFLVPMFDLWRGIFPSKYAWTYKDTFEELEANIDDALHYYPVRLHLSVWIPGSILCLFSFIWKKTLVILSSFSGAVLLVAVLIRNIYESESIIAELINMEDGNYCIGYWIALLLFILCGILAITVKTEEKDWNRFD